MSNNSNSKSGLYFIVGALLVAVLGLGFVVMNGQADKPDLTIDIGEDGLDIDTN